MKYEETEWMTWLHEYRATKENERLASGVDEVEWMRRTTARAREILAGLPRRDQAFVARDRPRRRGK